MGDYFDDDDLINEYMEEEFEPPAEYDEAFLEAELGANAADKKNDDAPPEPMEEDFPAAAEEVLPTENNMGVPTSVTIKPPERKPDVYSFERYIDQNAVIFV